LVNLLLYGTHLHFITLQSKKESPTVGFKFLIMYGLICVVISDVTSGLTYALHYPLPLSLSDVPTVLFIIIIFTTYLMSCSIPTLHLIQCYTLSHPTLFNLVQQLPHTLCYLLTYLVNYILI